MAATDQSLPLSTAGFQFVLKTTPRTATRKTALAAVARATLGTFLSGTAVYRGRDYMMANTMAMVMAPM